MNIQTDLYLPLLIFMGLTTFNQEMSAQSPASVRGPLPDMMFVTIPPGSFMMGSSRTEATERGKGRYENLINNDTPYHQVAVKSFQLMTTEVSCSQWDQLMKSDSGNEPERAKGNVTHQEILDFIARLNETDPGKNYRLPTEAEWEYACWAGSPNDGKSILGDDLLNRIAWTQQNSEKKIHPVGQKEPNAWGLYDMIGNVQEWCEDEYHPSYNAAPNDGSAWFSTEEPEKGVLRGGDCFLELFRCNAYARDWLYRKKNPHFTVGFRLARDFR